MLVMEYRKLHAWNVSLTDAAQIQQSLRSQLVLKPPPDFAPRLAAGADVSTTKDSDVIFAGFVVLDLLTRETVAEVTAVSTVTFPYVPGFLSFREMPALIEAWQQLTVHPDVLILDGQGIAHPRRMGIACHAGLVFDLPTIGCAKSILRGRHAPLDETRGSVQPLIDKQEVVGAAVRTRSRVMPVYVSPGHLMDLNTAVRLVLQLTPDGRYRLPETTRQAHTLVNNLRKRYQPD